MTSPIARSTGATTISQSVGEYRLAARRRPDIGTSSSDEISPESTPRSSSAASSTKRPSPLGHQVVRQSVLEGSGGEGPITPARREHTLKKCELLVEMGAVAELDTPEIQNPRILGERPDVCHRSHRFARGRLPIGPFTGSLGIVL
jgi:hypothetical protein